jgi:hypothetical protein
MQKSLSLVFLLFSLTATASEPVAVWLGPSPYWESAQINLAISNAKKDFLNGEVKIHQIGLLIVDEETADIEAKVLARYGLVKAELGCVVQEESKIYLKAYADFVNEELKRRYGKDVWSQIKKEIQDRKSAELGE